MTDAFVALEKPSVSHRLTVWLVVVGTWILVAQAWGLLAPLGFAPIAGTDDIGRALGLALALAITAIAWRLWPRAGAVRIRIDRDGIDWRGQGKRQVRWDEVDGIAGEPLRGMVKLAGELAGTQEGPIAVRLKPGAQHGPMAAGNRALGYGDLNLSTIGTDRSRAELEDALVRFAPAATMTLAGADGTGIERKG